MIVKQLIIIIGIFVQGQYVFGSPLPEEHNFNRKLLVKGGDPSTHDFVYFVSADCSAVQITADKVVTGQKCQSVNKICATGAAGAGAAPGAAPPSSTPAAAAGTTGAAGAAPGGGAGPGCADTKADPANDIGNGLIIVTGKLKDAAKISDPAAGPCFAAGFGEGAGKQTKGKGKCTVKDDDITIELEKGEICPGDTSGAILSDKGDLIGIIKAVTACAKKGEAVKASAVKSKAESGGGGGGGGEGGGEGSTTPSGVLPSTVAASMITVAFTGIVVILCGK